MHHWKEASNLPILTAADDADTSITYRARAIGAARLRDLVTARQNLLAIDALHATLMQEKKPSLVVNAVEEDGNVAGAWIDHAEGKNEEAMKLLRKIALKEKGVFAPDGGTPAHEMLGDMLLEMSQWERAVTEYEAELTLSPNRFDSLYGAAHAAELAHENEKATNYYRRLLEVCAGGESGRPELAHAKEFLSQLAKHN